MTYFLYKYTYYKDLYTVGFVFLSIAYNNLIKNTPSQSPPLQTTPQTISYFLTNSKVLKLLRIFKKLKEVELNNSLTIQGYIYYLIT